MPIIGLLTLISLWEGGRQSKLSKQKREMQKMKAQDSRRQGLMRLCLPLIHLSMLLKTFLAAKKVVLVRQIRLSPPTFVPNEDKNGEPLRPSERLRADRYELTVVWHRHGV